MNFFEDVMNDKNVNVNDLNLHFFITKDKRVDNGHDIYYLHYCDHRLAVPLLVAMKNPDKSISISKKVYHSSLWESMNEKILATRPDLNTRASWYAESLEALQNKLDKGQPDWKRGNPHVIDISKLEVYDMNDPDIVKKACA